MCFMNHFLQFHERVLQKFLRGLGYRNFSMIEQVSYSSKVLKNVIPDLSDIYDKSGLNDQRYVGVPAIIIEIISPSNQSHDLVTKLNLYMEFGVKEYWIVNPLLNTVQIYTLNEQGQYHQTDVVRETGIVQSRELPGFEVDIVKLFS